MKPVLLVIDVQKQFFEISPETAESLHKAIYFINEAISYFRENELPIIAIQHVDEAKGLISSSSGFEIPESLNILTSDQHITKTYGNAFNKTELEKILHDLGVDTVIISGFCAEYCVLSTYRGALDRDFTPALLKGALASVNSANISFVENINDIISLNLLKKALD